MEVKRIYVLPEYRNLGTATIILKELEIWAQQFNYDTLVLETGNKMPEAISFI